MRFDTLDEWLGWIEGLHPTPIDLGLERIRRVAQAMGCAGLPCPVVTVAGTNGKGSSVAMLEAILSAAGYRVAAYTSPHLLRYNERIRIGGREASDVELCAAFDQVDSARQGQTLTYFEFGTLAALDIFVRAAPDVAILEVGMGGRLDAVNLLDSDVALVTALGLDHMEWLGSDRDAIAREKGGIFRMNRPAVCSDPDPPQGLFAAASARETELYCLGAEFGCARDAADAGLWSWWGPRGSLTALPRPGLAGDFQLRNAAGVLMVLDLLAGALTVSDRAVRLGLTTVQVPGRFQKIPGDILRILDVAHNADSTRVLAQMLVDEAAAGATRAVVAILGDKDIDGMISSMAGVVDDWHVAALKTARAAPVERLRAAVARATRGAPVYSHPDVSAAYRAALSVSAPGDRIVVFGSFYTVGEVLRLERNGVTSNP